MNPDVNPDVIGLRINPQTFQILVDGVPIQQVMAVTSDGKVDGKQVIVEDPRSNTIQVSLPQNLQGRPRNISLIPGPKMRGKAVQIINQENPVHHTAPPHVIEVVPPPGQTINQTIVPGQ